VDVETMVDSVVFEIGYVAGDIYYSHGTPRLSSSATTTSLGGVENVDTTAVDGADVIAVLEEAARAVSEALSGLDDWGPTGTRRGQYRCDVVADEAAIEVITAAGMGVVSEESGVHSEDRPIMVVLDPVDGSTNASLGLPWWATSLCAVDNQGPLAAVVVNQPLGKVYKAVRGEGATADGKPIRPTACDQLSKAVVAFCGVPKKYLGWTQARVLGAAALDICAVAEGVLDAYVDGTGGSLAPWDYLGGLLVCREAGAVIEPVESVKQVESVESVEGRGLVTISHSARRAPVAAATPQLLNQIRTALST
jgi:myo-inositol-1(or 4)-monophosphatase